MITFKHSLLFSLFSLLIFTSHTQAQQTQKTDAKAQQIIERYLEAIGGRENLAKVKSWKVFGRMQRQGIEATLNTTIKYDKIRVEAVWAGMSFIQAYDGEKVWEINPAENEGKPRYALNSELNALSNICMYYPMFLIGRDRNQAMYDSTGVWQGKQVHVLHYGEGSAQKIYYFDKQTGLLVYCVTSTHRNHIQGYENKKDASGLYLPKNVKVNTDDTQAVIDSIQANPEVSDSLFAFPKEEMKQSSSSVENLVAEGKLLEADPKLTVKQILTEYNETYKSAKNRTKNITLRGEVFVNQGEKSFPMYFVLLPKEKKSYGEVDLGKKTFYKRVDNGDIVWELQPSSNKPTIVEKGSDKGFLGFGFHLFDLPEGNVAKELEYASRVYIGKILYHKLSLKESKRMVHCYLEANKYASVIIKTEGVGGIIDCLKGVNQNGVIVPRFMYVNSNGVKVMMKVNKCTFDEPVNKKLFEFPSKKKK